MVADDVPDGWHEDHNVELRRFGTPQNRIECCQGSCRDWWDAGVDGFWDCRQGGRCADDHFEGLWHDWSGFGFVYAGCSFLRAWLYRDQSAFVGEFGCYVWLTTNCRNSMMTSLKTTDGRWLIPLPRLFWPIWCVKKFWKRAFLFVCVLWPLFPQGGRSAGKDTRGMIRQHQFYKVEMVSVVKPWRLEAEHQRMTDCAENIFENWASVSQSFCVRAIWDLLRVKPMTSSLSSVTR